LLARRREALRSSSGDHLNRAQPIASSPVAVGTLIGALPTRSWRRLWKV
jgi:hypothetical protein